MKKLDRRSSHHAETQKPPHRRRMMSEVRALFEQMTDEAKRRTKRQPQEAQNALARLLLALTLTAGLLAAATMLYGIYNFPDAPLKQTPSGYAGKHGTLRTQGDFEAFVRWEKAMFIVFPSVFVLGFAYAIADARQRRKRQT